MKSSGNPISVALLVDRDGALVRVLRDEAGLCKNVSVGQSIVNLVDVSSRTKIVRFMEELRLQKVAFDWEVGFITGDAVTGMHMFGRSANENVLHMLLVGLLAPDSGQSDVTRAACRDLSEQLCALPDQERESLDDLTRLNNELSNLHRALAKKNVQLQQVARELQESLDQVKVLRGLLPICASCKKIRDDKGYWNQLEQYLTQYTDVKLTHGLCPDCEKVYFRSEEVK
jgi:hypothetical protein